MKKIIRTGELTTIMLCLLSMTSCDVHFGNVHYDVPWWVIAIPVCLFSFAVFFAAGKHISSSRYICPKCSKSFYPKFWEAATSLHIGEDRMFTCPHCKNHGLCKKE